MEALLALAIFHFNRRDFELAREVAEKVVATAQKAEASAMLAGGYLQLGLCRFSTGQFLAAREHLERAVELFGEGLSRNVSAFIGLAPRVASVMVVNVLVILGYPLTALSRAHELLAAVHLPAEPDSFVAPLLADLMHHVLLRDTRMVAERADEMLSIATEHERLFILQMATFFRGWAMAAAGRAEEGIAEMHRSISSTALSEAVAAAQLLVALAETCGKNGRAEEGLDLVGKGLATAEQTGQTVAESELHRLKGELLLIKDLGNGAEAERCLRSAIDVARAQGARLFELRATVSLARLLRDTNRREEARAMLTEIYGWFTEGFDTADLKEARALIEELNR
jgi:tetratricopeptide (TPR) repeat protein